MRRSMVRKVVLGYLLFVFLPTLALGCGYFLHARDQLLRERMEGLRATFAQSLRNVEYGFGAVANLHRYIQQNNNFLRFLDGEYETPIEQVVQYLREFETMFGYTQTAVEAVEKVRVYMLDESLSEMGEYLLPIAELGDYALDTATARGYWRYAEADNRLVYRRALTDPSRMRMLAILEIRCRTTLLTDSLSAFLEDPQYALSIDVNKTRYQIEPGALRPLGEEGRSASLEARFAPFAGLARLRAAWAERFMGRDWNVLGYMLVMLACLVALSLIYFNMVLGISRRIAGFARHIEASRLATPMPAANPPGDDVDELIAAYNHVLMVNDDLTDQVKLARLRQREASFLALQAQMNPHFIYNALEDIRMTAELQNATRTADLIYTMSRLIRYVLSTKTRLVTLADEYRYAEQYLQIQKMRLDERLDYAMAIDAAAAPLPCPKFILQPLVENALAHGIAPKPAGGRVAVSVHLAEGWAEITVSDDGAGLDAAAREALNERLAQGQPVESAGAGNGIGLTNVCTRMRLLCGQSFSLRLLAGEDGGTRAIMRWRTDVIA